MYVHQRGGRLSSPKRGNKIRVERKKEILGREECSKKHWSREKPELKRNERRRDVNENKKEEVVKETVNKLLFFHTANQH
jgi:hypothetical protein